MKTSVKSAAYSVRRKVCKESSAKSAYSIRRLLNRLSAGLAVGLGSQGFRPIAEIQFVGFIYEALDQMFVQAARMRYRSGGRYNSPIVFRTPFGGGVKAAELHTDSLEGLAIQTPGIKVVVPSNPYDAKGLLISAIRDNDPVFFMEHLNLYRAFRDEVPEGEYTVDDR